MRRVDVSFDSGNINCHSAETSATPIGLLRRHSAAAIMHLIFPRSPIALITPRLEIGLRERRQKFAPRFAKCRARHLKSPGSSVRMPLWLDARIETAAPSPLIDVDRDARALSDRADLHIPIEHMPNLSAGVRFAAAGKGGHLQ
jgi:hypothetical protein